MEEHKDLARYERLIYKVAHKTMLRLTAAGARSASLEDIAQEYRVAWLIASRAFDPTRGIPWMPFLINGLRKHSFSVMRKYTFKTKEESYALSIWDTADLSDEGEGNALESRIAADTVDPVEFIAQKEVLAKVLKRLSPRAAQFLRLLADPPVEITDELLRLRDKTEFGRSLGFRSGTNMTVTSSMIFDLMDAGRFERTKIMNEINTLGDKLWKRK